MLRVTRPSDVLFAVPWAIRARIVARLIAGPSLSPGVCGECRQSYDRCDCVPEQDDPDYIDLSVLEPALAPHDGIQGPACECTIVPNECVCGWLCDLPF